MTESEYQFAAQKIDADIKAQFDKIRQARAEKIRQHDARKARTITHVDKAQPNDLL